MTIEEYIKSKPKMKRLRFTTIYSVILDLIADGFIPKDAFDRGEKDVETVES